MAKRVINGTLFKESWTEIDDKITAFLDQLNSVLSTNENGYKVEVEQEL